MDLVLVFCRQISSFSSTFGAYKGVYSTFVKNWEGIAAKIHIWVFYSVPNIFISVFLPMQCCSSDMAL
jgi:hypothetical protein